MLSIPSILDQIAAVALTPVETPSDYGLQARLLHLGSQRRLGAIPNTVAPLDGEPIWRPIGIPPIEYIVFILLFLMKS